MSVKENTLWEVILTPINTIGRIIRFTEKPTAHDLRVALRYRKGVVEAAGSLETPRASLLLEVAQFVPEDFVDQCCTEYPIRVADVVIATVQVTETTSYTVKSQT